MNFKRGEHPYDVLGIGVKKLTEDWLKKHSITNYLINLTGDNGKKICEIDVDGDIILYDLHLNSIFKKEEWPEYIRFGDVSGKVIFCNNASS